MPQIMSCAGHVKVIDRTVYFRYGGFWYIYYRLDRFLQTVKMIQVTMRVCLPAHDEDDPGDSEDDPGDRRQWVTGGNACLPADDDDTDDDDIGSRT